MNELSAASRRAPCVRRSLSLSAPCDGACVTAMLADRRGVRRPRLHVDGSLPRTARRAGRVTGTPLAPPQVTPFNRTGAHAAPERRESCADLAMTADLAKSRGPNGVPRPPSPSVSRAVAHGRAQSPTSLRAHRCHKMTDLAPTADLLFMQQTGTRREKLS